MSEDYHCDEDDSLEILNRIPDNPSTMPFRHWVTGSLPSEHLGIDDCIEALLWSDHGVAIRAVDEPSDRTYYVDHNGDLQALAGEREISSPNEAAVMLDGDLDAAAVDVVAILIEDAPGSVRAIGKEIVTDGGRDFVEQNAGRCDICGKLINMEAGEMLTTATYSVDEEIKAEHDLTDEDAINGVADALERVAESPAGYDLAETIRETGEMRAHVSCLDETNYSELETDIEPDDGLETDGGQQVSDSAARLYCPGCKCWRSLDDGDCNICGETIKEVATDGGECVEKPPDYSRAIDADKLLRRFAAHAADYAYDHDEKRQWYQESLDMLTAHHDARLWMLEALGGRRAFREAMVTLQPGGRFRNDDDTVAVRSFMAWLSERAEVAHKRSYGPYAETRQADEAETAYTRMLSILRDDFGVGWPRMDEVGGVKEGDLP